jgi:hypothetical protein
LAQWGVRGQCQGSELQFCNFESIKILFELNLKVISNCRISGLTPDTDPRHNKTRGAKASRARGKETSKEKELATQVAARSFRSG